jgi:hypothetical protein
MKAHKKAEHSAETTGYCSMVDSTADHLDDMKACLQAGHSAEMKAD